MTSFKRSPGNGVAPGPVAGIAAILLGTVLALLPGPVGAAPATLIGATPDRYATGALGEWDFSGTDMTFKAERGELWVLDAHSDVLPFVNVFALGSRESPFPDPPVRLTLQIPEELREGRALGIAEISTGAYQGMNLVLVDRAFVSGGKPDPYFAVLDDEGNPLDEVAPSPVAGLPDGTQLSSIAFNPEAEEIAAYDLTLGSVFILDLSFSIVGGPFPTIGVANFFSSEWYLGNQLLGSGAGIAYAGPDRLLVDSGFVNLFESRFALEYATETGAYAGRALDLVTGGTAGSSPQRCFLALATGKLGSDDVLAALDFASDAVYLFDLDPQDEPPLAELTDCTLEAETGGYLLRWVPPANFEPDSYRIFENGVQVASLPPSITEYVSPFPILGKIFVEVAAEKAGVTSDLRQVCQVENTEPPPLDGVEASARQMPDPRTIELEGIAVTKAPASLEEFRLFLLRRSPFGLLVLDHTLADATTILGSELAVPGRLELSPPVAEAANNVPPRGIALAKLDGIWHAALLDPDGEQGGGAPSARFHAIEGASPGSLSLLVPGIDVSALPQPLDLLDWDVDPEGHFVAGGAFNRGGGLRDYFLVRIEFDGTSLVAVASLPFPQRGLTPFDELAPTGIALSVLPSGNLLVAGSDTFSRTYTEALLVTPFSDDLAASLKLVGYAQGLIVTNQYYDYGPGIGPRFVRGLDSAYFPPAAGEEVGVGVSYLVTPDLALLQGPGIILTTPGQIVVHSTNACSHPDLAAEQLADVTLDLPSGASDGTGERIPSFAGEVDKADYFHYVLNLSTTDAISLRMGATLDGEPVEGWEQDVEIPPGRYHRGMVAGAAPGRVDIRVKNLGAARAEIRLVAGAMGVRVREPGPSQFRRGDCAADDGEVSISDAVFGLGYLYLGGEEPTCLDACDTDDDGRIILTDMVAVLMYLFMAGESPAPPGPDACGSDPTTDDEFTTCRYDARLCP